ncbi:MAG: C4-type zinc ribbon domain-containing protein [Candidatus Omnitrophica bacterium]|nr:C4-type zinc ribbon domain-containing protein [Candidatus Omnitrophota bacterium]MDD5429688.1 C4-type zinc ribbon domain-containing protein [Candidatus Omnitrophota bacterium]
MSIKDEIRKIAELQELDTEIYVLQKDKDTKCPLELERMKAEFECKKQALLSIEEKIKQLQLKKKEKEVDLAAKEENLRKSQGHLYQLKTNKDYQAKLNEIGAIKADISVVEEDILKIFDDIESATASRNAEKETLNKEEGKYKEQEMAILNKVKDAEIKINSLLDKRKILAKEVDKNIISRYEQLLKTRQGLAITPVMGGNCGACHMLLNHQKINEIKMYERLVFCESCVRILYISDDIKL